MNRANQIPVRLCLIGFFLIATSSAFNVEKAPARVLVSQDRSVDDGYTVEIEANGETRQLRLTPLENIWSEYAQSVTITRNENGEEVFERRNIPNDIKTYHDSEVGSVLSLSDGKVNGIIDGEYTIKSENDQHFVIKTNKKTADQLDYLEVPEYVPGMVVKRSFIGRNDSIPIPIPLMNKDENRQIPTYSPEISFVVDKELATQIGLDANIYKYLTIFSNGIKKRFQTITNPIINIKIVGCVIIRDSASEPFITNNIISGSGDVKVNGNKVLEHFSDWIFTKGTTIPDYDMYYLISGKNLVDSGGSDGLAGIAWVGAVCLKNGQSRSYATGIGEDIGRFYNGVHTATHEIAHNLGSPHDNSTVAETNACSWARGYIMSYVGGVKNHLLFSICSINSMLNCLKNAICVNVTIANTSPTGVYTSTQLPGEVVSMQTQCIRSSGKGNAEVFVENPQDSLCYNLKCKYMEGNTTWILTTFNAAAEGSKCPSGDKKCINGACVPL